MIYLASYPRSGNTFFRYCTEVLSGRPTLGCAGSSKDTPIYKRVDTIEIRDDAPIIRKGHFWRNMPQMHSGTDAFVLLVRDYKESILRHRWRFIKDVDKVLDHSGEDYMRLVIEYDRFTGPKQIIYYEDLIDDDTIYDTLLSVASILDFDKNNIASFVENIEYHRKQSLTTYLQKTFTSGKAKKHHQLELSVNERKQMDRYFREYDSYLYEKYLKRYEI